MSLLKQNITKKELIDKNITKLDIGINESKKFKIKAICNNSIYTKELIDYLLRFYYFIS